MQTSLPIGPKHQAFGGRAYREWTIEMIQYVLKDFNIHDSPGGRKKKLTLWEHLLSLEKEHNLSQDKCITLYLKASNREVQTKRKSGAQKEGTKQKIVKLKVGRSNDASTTAKRPELSCAVCLETLTANNTPRRKATSNCKHSSDVCQSCFTQAITSQFEMRTWELVSCPSCNIPLSYQDVKAFAEPAAFSRYV